MNRYDESFVKQNMKLEYFRHRQINRFHHNEVF
jgi:hypothetical protein